MSEIARYTPTKNTRGWAPVFFTYCGEYGHHHIILGLTTSAGNSNNSVNNPTFHCFYCKKRWHKISECRKAKADKAMKPDYNVNHNNYDDSESLMEAWNCIGHICYTNCVSFSTWYGTCLVFEGKLWTAGNPWNRWLMRITFMCYNMTQLVLWRNAVKTRQQESTGQQLRIRPWENQGQNQHNLKLQSCATRLPRVFTVCWWFPICLFRSRL